MGPRCSDQALGRDADLCLPKAPWRPSGPARDWWASSDSYDDTTVRIAQAGKPGSSKKGRLWIYTGSALNGHVGVTRRLPLMKTWAFTLTPT